MKRSEALFVRGVHLKTKYKEYTYFLFQQSSFDSYSKAFNTNAVYAINEKGLFRPRKKHDWNE